MNVTSRSISNDPKQENKGDIQTELLVELLMNHMSSVAVREQDFPPVAKGIKSFAHDGN